eukprot:tig00000190_g13858.t1
MACGTQPTFATAFTGLLDAGLRPQLQNAWNAQDYATYDQLRFDAMYQAENVCMMKTHEYASCAGGNDPTFFRSILDGARDSCRPNYQFVHEATRFHLDAEAQAVAEFEADLAEEDFAEAVAEADAELAAADLAAF